MDLFQLLSQMPFIDLQKLTAKVIQPWGWNLDSVSTGEAGQPPEEPLETMPTGMEEGGLPSISSGDVSPELVKQAVAMLGGTPAPGASPFAEAGTSIDLLKSGAMPPTAPGIPVGKTTNPRGMNRKVGGGVNTNIPNSGNSSIESNLMNRVQNIQK